MRRKKIKILVDYIFIYIGTLITSIGVNAFLVPSNLAPGGVTGASVLINHLTNIPVSTLIFVLNIPLVVVGTKIFGKEYGFKTMVGITFLSLNIAFTKAVIPNIDQILDYSVMANIMLGTLYGGIFMGAGLGLVIKNGGTTGGSDIVAGILHKYFPIQFGEGLVIVDSLVVMAAGYIFGAEKALYALINLYITGVVINKMINGLGTAKMVYIVTSEPEKVGKIITDDLGKTGNLSLAKGIFTGEKRDIITTVLRSRELHLLKELILEMDKEAFVVVSDAHEVIGRGYTFDFEAGQKIRKDKDDKK